MLRWTHFKALSVDEISFQLIQGTNLKIEIALTSLSENNEEDTVHRTFPWKAVLFH